MDDDVGRDASRNQPSSSGLGGHSAATTSEPGPDPAPAEKISHVRAEVPATCPAEAHIGSDFKRPDQQLVYTCRFCLGTDNQMSMVTPCNCKGAFNRAHANCVVLHVCRNGVQTCPVCQYDFIIRLVSKKTFREWLRDSDHLPDHVMFLLSVLFALSVILVLTFAWLQAGKTLPHSSWILTLPLYFVLVVQSITWLGFAFFSLWLYRKAYLDWKNHYVSPSTRKIDPEALQISNYSVLPEDNQIAVASAPPP